MHGPCLYITFNNLDRSQNNTLRDDCGTIIPKELIAQFKRSFICFAHGWNLEVKKDSIEIHYPGQTFLFCEGTIKMVSVIYD